MAFQPAPRRSRPPSIHAEVQRHALFSGLLRINPERRAEQALPAMLRRAAAVSATGRTHRRGSEPAPRDRPGRPMGPKASDHPAPARLPRAGAHVQTLVRGDSGAAGEAGAPRRHPPPPSASTCALGEQLRWPRAASQRVRPALRWGAGSGQSSRSYHMSDTACSDTTFRGLLANPRSCGAL